MNHARTGIVMALRAALPNGGRVGVVAYNCHTVANAVVNAECTPVFVDVTEELRIDVESVPRDLDAIVVTNLFGIRNDVEAIRKRCPGAVVIVDNAHGYGLPVEGDFTVYSINQGKFPALGEGGILIVSQKLPTIDQKLFEGTKTQINTVPEINKKNYSKNTKNISAITEALDKMYAELPGYGFVGQVKLFVQMWVKAVAYSKLCYWFVRKLKDRRLKELKSESIKEKVVMKQMAPGVRRLYKAWLPTAEQEIAKQRQNAEQISNLQSAISNDQFLIGSNAFMAIIRTNDVAAAKADFAKRGIETETHFARCIDWATEFGYKAGSCPTAERITKQLLMIPTYSKSKKI